MIWSTLSVTMTMVIICDSLKPHIRAAAATKNKVTENIESPYDANFTNTAGCRYDNLRSHQWRKIDIMTIYFVIIVVSLLMTIQSKPNVKWILFMLIKPSPMNTFTYMNTRRAENLYSLRFSKFSKKLPKRYWEMCSFHHCFQSALNMATVDYAFVYLRC